MSIKNILITGADGQLGKELLARPPSGYRAIAANRETLDITSQRDVFEFFGRLELTGVINAAAYTAVDKAESEPEIATAVNTHGVANLGLAAREHGVPIVHISTDFVFDGKKTTPYLPHDKRAPMNVYGTSKADGEDALVTIEKLHSTIIRTAWVYNTDDSNFVTTMLRLMQERDSLGVVADQIGTPTHVSGLAGACWFFIQHDEAGIFHWTDAGVASWYDFAVAIQSIALETGHLTKRIPVKPIKTSAYPTPAVRPEHSVLDKTSCWEIMGISPEHWQSALRTAFAEK